MYGSLSADQKKINVRCPVIGRKFVANHMFIRQYGSCKTIPEGAVLVDAALVAKYKLLKTAKRSPPTAEQYQYLVGKQYVEEDDGYTYEVTRVAVDRRRNIVAYVKCLKNAFSRSKGELPTPIHIAYVERMYLANA